MALFSYRKPLPIIYIIVLCVCFISSAQESAELSKWDESLVPLIENTPQFETLSQEQLDKLLESEKGKIKIVHFSGAWYKMGYALMFPLMDYLNQHKKEHVELSVILILNTVLSNKNAELLTDMMDWTGERGIHLNYYIVNPKELKEFNSAWTGTIPYSYFVEANGSFYKANGHSKENMAYLLRFVEEDAVKTIDEVKTLYTKEWRNAREKITVEGKDYYLIESEKWTLEAKYRDYKSNIWVKEGEAIVISAMHRRVCCL